MERGQLWDGMWRKRDLALVLILLMALLARRTWQHDAAAIGDFYPLYWGGKALLATGNAYDFAPVAPLADHGTKIYEGGNGYPLPAILLALPLVWLPPQIAAILWLALLCLGLIVALRLSGGPWWAWPLLTYPVEQGLHLKQYTILIFIAHLVGLWAVRHERPWIVGGCVALLLTKPQQGLLFAAILILQSRRWRPVFILPAIVWVGASLLQPKWPIQWLTALARYREVLDQPVLWPLALFALPLLFWRDWPSAAIIGQLGLAPFPQSYAAASLPTGILGERYAIVLILLGWLPILAGRANIIPGPLAILGGTALLVIGVVMVSGLRARRASTDPAPGAATSVNDDVPRDVSAGKPAQHRPPVTGILVPPPVSPDKPPG